MARRKIKIAVFLMRHMLTDAHSFEFQVALLNIFKTTEVNIRNHIFLIKVV